MSQSSHFIDSKTAPVIRQFEGLETTILTGVRGEKMMMVLSVTLPKHAVSIHSHPHEQVGVVFSGRARLRIGSEERVVKKGDFYCIPPNVPHGDICLGSKPFVMLDIFCPVREDFMQKLRSQKPP
ncbi:MAG: cupin domain-containing protein [Candidatus Bathyarchaeia archaeon]